MKKLFKILALWLVKITGLNLVEPYCLEHLKRMIYSVDADYSKFKYKPFLVQLEAFHKSGDYSAKIPFLIDCINIEDAKKIVESVRNSLYNKEYLTGIDTNKHIQTKEVTIDTKKEVGLLTDEFKEGLQRMQVLSGFESFDAKVSKAKHIVKGSPFYLFIDILTGTSEIKNTQKILISAPADYPGIQIGIQEIYTDDQSDNEKIEAPSEGS